MVNPPINSLTKQVILASRKKGNVYIHILLLYIPKICDQVSVTKQLMCNNDVCLALELYITNKEVSYNAMQTTKLIKIT